MTAYFDALLLGLVEGITEFLPVSSTGHLILVADLLKFSDPGQVFSISIQLGAILAIVWLYRQKLLDLVRNLAIASPPSAPLTEAQRQARTLTLGLLVAFLPAALLGAVLHHFIKDHLFNPLTVSVMLIAGGVGILLIEKFKPAPSITALDDIPLRTALLIGLFQCLALIPGISRSGATIMGALCLRVERKAAAEFSFFLAIPTLAAASLFDLIANWRLLDGESLIHIGIGFISAFISALVVVKAFIAFIGRYGFVPFAWYRIAVGILMLVLLYA